MNIDSNETENFIVYPITRQKYEFLKTVTYWMWNVLSISLVCLVLGEIFSSSYFILPPIVWGIIFVTSFCFLVGIKVIIFFSANSSPLRVFLQEKNIQFVNTKEGRVLFDIIPQPGSKVVIKSLGGVKGPIFIVFHQANGDIFPFVFNRHEILYKKISTRKAFVALRENLEKMGINTRDTYFNRLGKELYSFVIALVIILISFIIMEFK